MTRIVVLTGAGISAESGLGTFRDKGGIWAQHRIEDVATPEAFDRDPARVVAFYNTRRAQAAEAAPTPAHAALARLEADASTAEIRQLLVDWWIDRDGRSVREARDAAAFRQAMRETLIAVARTLTPAQRAEARRRLQDRAAFLRRLAETAE